MWQIDSADVARRQALVMALANEVRSEPHELWRVQAPALVVCAIGSMERSFGWLTRDSARWQLASDLAKQLEARGRVLCEESRRQLARGELVMLDSGHYVFLDQSAEVVEAMKRFLASVTERVPYSATQGGAICWASSPSIG
jgi:hypothetical protein